MEWPRIKKIVSVCIVIIFFWWLYRYISLHSVDFVKAFHLNYGIVVVLFLLSALSLYINGLIIKTLVNKLGANLNNREGLLVSLATSLFNLITPFRGGVFFSAIYLKKKHNFDYTKYLVTVGGSYVILFLFVCVVFFVAVIGMWARYHFFNLPLFLIFLGLFLFLLGLIIIHPTFVNYKGWFGRWLQRLAAGWNMIRSDRKMLMMLALYNCLYLLLGFIFMLTTLVSLGSPLVIFPMLFLFSSAFLTFFINITPAAVGIYETVMLLVSGLVSIPISNVLLFAIIFRVVTFCTIIILLLPYSRSLLGIIKKIPQKVEDKPVK